MTREEKANIIQSIKTDLDASSSIYITDCSGLDAITTSKLRRACFKSNIRLSIVKNTLLTRAMDEGDKDFGELKSWTLIVFIIWIWIQSFQQLHH